MIKNPTHNRHFGRMVQYNDDWTQVTVGDMRFYKKESTYYPSVTYILSYYPKGKQFENWLKSKGEEANEIAAESAEKGTNVHKAVEEMLEGKELKWIDSFGNVIYTEDEWRMILRFADFWNTWKPKLVKSEYHIFSNQYQFAGTIDLVIELNGELWILDLKTSNQLHFTYDLQLASYYTAWNELHPEDPAKKYGVLWLNAKTRKTKEGEFQGKGWKLSLPEFPHEKNMEIFKYVHEIFKVENPNPVPIIDNYQNSIKLVL